MMTDLKENVGAQTLQKLGFRDLRSQTPYCFLPLSLLGSLCAEPCKLQPVVSLAREVCRSVLPVSPKAHNFSILALPVPASLV